MITYRLATINDNQQLIKLAAASGMSGEISLRIDRQPDFFKLLRLRGESKVFLAVDGDQIVGSLCVSVQQVYVGGSVFPLQYIGDFKVAESFRNQGIGLKLCDQLADHVVSQGADLAFLNVSKGNNKPLSFFKNRPNIPDFENIGIFNIRQFIGRKNKPYHATHTIEAIAPEYELIHFLNSRFRNYELGNVITQEQLEGTESYVVRNSKEIIAAISLMDTMDFKQNVVTGLSLKIKYLLKFINAVYRISGISKMPGINQPVRMLYAKYFVVSKHDKDLVKFMISHARNLAYEKGYSFVSIGVHEKDPLNSYFRGMLKLTFHSVGMLVSLKNNKQLIEKVKSGIPFEDYSLV